MLTRQFYKTIKFKVTFAFSFTFIFIFLLSSIIIYKNIKHNIIKADNQNLLSRAEIIASKVNISPLVIPLPEEDEKIRIDYYNNDFYKNLYKSVSFPNVPITKSVPLIIDSKNERIAINDINQNKYNNEKIRVFILKSNINLKSDINFLFYTLLFSNLIGIFFASIISYFLTGYFLKPINNIINRANSINLSEKPELLELPKSNDELEMLSDTINNMLKRIHSSVKMQSNFFASASHELKTPLAILQTEIEVNLNDKNLSLEMQNLLKSQLEEVNRLKRLIDDFLIVSQLNNKILKLRYSNFELDELLFDVIKKVNPLLLLSQQRIEIRLDENADDFIINADRDKIMNVLINLIENSIKYSSAKEINVELLFNKENNKYIIQIKNKIAKVIENIDNLKDEFYRADILKDGHGLGLWISNKLINLHSGKLLLKQENENFISQIIIDKS